MTLFNSLFNVSFDTFPGYQPHWYWQPTKKCTNTNSQMKKLAL